MRSPAFLALLLFVAPGVQAQGLPSLSEGQPYGSRSWTWRDYQAHNQNWGVTQSARGIVYVANSDGLLEYDGEAWRQHALPVGEEPTVRSVVSSARGPLYTGGIGDFGVWAPDRNGTLQYTSLRAHVPEADRAFSDVWSTHVIPEGVVFQSAERLFLWDGREMRSWSAAPGAPGFRTAFRIGDAVYVQEVGVGLRMLRGGRLGMAPGGRALADRKVDAVLPHPDGLLLVVRDEGLVLLSQGTSHRLEGVASDYLTAYRPYTAVAVPNPYDGRAPLYAVATFGGGVAVVTPDGRLVRVYREDVGLSESDLLVGLHNDAQGGLWVAHLNGVLRIDLFGQSTWFGEETGLVGSVYVTETYKGTIYAGTTVGVYRLHAGHLGRPGNGTQEYARFERVGPEAGQTWALLATEHGLLVGTGSGVFAIVDGGSYVVTETAGFALLSATGEGKSVLVGQTNGIGVLTVEGGRWVVSGRVPGVDGEVRHLISDPGGGVWATETSGHLVHISDFHRRTPVVRTFGPAEGLSASVGPLTQARDEVWMFPREGAYSVIRDGDRIRLEPVPELRGVTGVYSLYEVGDDVWLGREGVIRPLSRGRYRRSGPRFELRGVQVISVREGAEGVLWIGTVDGLLRYDPRVEAGERRYPASVRLVTDRERTSLFGGAGALGAPLVIPHDRSREVRFEVAAGFFAAPGRTEYQYRLDGFEDAWGTWSTERVASFTNLWPGAYTLHVRARDAHGNVSEEATFAFEVLPPWYLTWWAAVLYAVMAVSLVWGLSAWRSREHRRKLDAQRARSARLHRLSARLEKTVARLRQADKLKDDLLANTSHELRTPLTAILGFSEMLLVDAAPDDRDLAEGIHRGGQRLLKTVNGLLDMFKLQSGTMPVEIRSVDAAAHIRQSIGLLHPLARAQRTALRVLPETLSLRAALDPDLLDRIVTNVVSNAIKFTDEGDVTVLIDGDDQTLRLTVRDSGVGIAEGDLGRILEPFEQASTGFGRTHEGTGLGLSIVRRVLDLIGGDIDFESEVGVGTTVTVVVPREWGGPVLERMPGTEGYHPVLDGIYLLGVGLDESTEDALNAVVSRHGTLSAVPTLGRALREARTAVYDVVLLAAGDETSERRQIRTLRNVPGYHAVSIVRVGGDGLPEAELEGRGFSGAIAVPLDVDELTLRLEAAVSRVENDGVVFA